MADLVGITYQQGNKYETGINRVSVTRLYDIAQVLGANIDSFFKDLRSDVSEAEEKGRLMLELARNFAAIPDLERQEAVMTLVRSMADNGAEDGAGE